MSASLRYRAEPACAASCLRHRLPSPSSSASAKLAEDLCFSVARLQGRFPDGYQRRIDGDLVFDLGDTRCRVRGALGFLALRPRAHGPPQRHHAPAGFDGHVLRVDLRAALECILDLALDVDR